MKDYTGKRCGRLVVIKRSEEHPNKLVCQCDCGNVTEVLISNFYPNHTRSCGCLKSEIIKAGAHTTHGMRYTRLYKIWSDMRKRCKNLNGNRSQSYAGKGITVCEEWNDFSNFEAWAMENGYGDDLTIDRVDNDGNYCPENCRWTTVKVQANNRSSNHFLEYGGERKTIAEWSDVTGIAQSVLMGRIRLGWDVERTLTEPVRSH